MATLTSPGLSITITDESQYVSTGVGSIPLVLLATQENKTSPATGGIASGTTAANAGKLQVFNSQRELINGLGYPSFKSSSGSQLHGDERNEYGLLAAHSALGIGSSVYVIRADIDLAQLTATAVRPTGAVGDGYLWLDLSSTNFGLFVWNSVTQTYASSAVTVINDTSLVNSDSINTPLSSVGQVGSYAIVVTNPNNPMFYRVDTSAAATQFPGDWSSQWVALGTDAWQKAWPTVQSTKATYAGNEVANGTQITINGVTVTCNATDGVTCTSTDVITSINTAFASAYGDGIKADYVAGRLVIRATSAAKSNGTDADGKVIIASGSGATALGLTAGTYYAPMLDFGGYTQVPSFGSGEATPAPTGSIWIKTSSVGGGASWAVKQYKANTAQFVAVAAPMYDTREDALYGLDPLNGGIAVTSGTVFVQYSTLQNYPATFQVMQRSTQGITKVSATSAPAAAFVIGNTFSLSVTQAGSPDITTYSFTINSTTTAGFVALVLSANIPNVFAEVESNGAISFIHRAGGDIIMTNGTGTPLTNAGFSTSIHGVYYEVGGAYYQSLRATNWANIGSSLAFSVSTPYVAPMDGTLWYYANAYEADIMVCGNSGWVGYRTLSSDARGFDLTLTDTSGPIFSPSQPTLQSTGNAVVSGDIWVDTSDMENFPKMRRYNSTSRQWVLIDNTDRITQNGIVFADARWDASVDGMGAHIGGIVDPVTGTIPPISGMLLSDYHDLDAPDYRLYPRGTLLWNTRRNGWNVKQYVSTAFTSANYPNATVDPSNHTVGYLPTYAATWSTASGTSTNGTPYMGHYAQRQMVVKALKAAINSSTTIREDQYQFNLLVCPGYPELIADLNSLNDDRNQTAFIIGDTPINLSTNNVDITNWSNTVETTGSKMVGVYYPSGLATDPSTGASVAVPASHMALRTYIHSDNVSYQWFAPAGSRRGLIDNASNIGYVDYSSGNFVQTGVTQALRDTLYDLRINPITNLPGQGLTIFGNKTRDPISESSNRVNVARLVNYIRTILGRIGNGFLFEPNDKGTRDQLKASIEGALNDLVAKRGIYDYLVVCDTSNNTPDRIAANQLYVDIAIEPMKDVEFIFIPVRLLNPGSIGNLGK